MSFFNMYSKIKQKLSMKSAIATNIMDNTNTVYYRSLKIKNRAKPRLLPEFARLLAECYPSSISPVFCRFPMPKTKYPTITTAMNTAPTINETRVSGLNHIPTMTRNKNTMVI